MDKDSPKTMDANYIGICRRAGLTSWELNALCDLALLGLSAKSQGLRELREAALKALDLYESQYRPDDSELKSAYANLRVALGNPKETCAVCEVRDCEEHPKCDGCGEQVEKVMDSGWCRACMGDDSEC